MRISVRAWALLLLVTCAASLRVYPHDFAMSDLAFILDSKNQQPNGKTVNSNLKAPNWVYGGLNESEFKLQEFRMLTSGSNIVKCQLEVPFFNGDRCITCTGSTPYFNIQTKLCDKCPSGMEAHRCK